MPAGRLLRAGVVALIAPAGVLIGHALTYLLAVPDPAERAAVMAAGGHQWWKIGTIAGPALAAAGVAVLMVAVLRRPPDGGRFRRELSRWLWPRLAACQLGLFFVIETLERAISGDPLSGDLYHEIIEHGVLAQLVVALAVTSLCWCLALAVDLACVALSPEPVPVSVAITPSALIRIHPARMRRRLIDARAPPRLAR
ncbi:MAG TPA: hypothetical protein VFR23_03515 [Jiangellaceae bacterium]|nr:hypothetical protein [Jiangellaceae bacterium]